MGKEEIRSGAGRQSENNIFIAPTSQISNTKQILLRERRPIKRNETPITKRRKRKQNVYTVPSKSKQVSLSRRINATCNRSSHRRHFSYACRYSHQCHKFFIDQHRYQPLLTPSHPLSATLSPSPTPSSIHSIFSSSRTKKSCSSSRSLVSAPIWSG